MDATACGFSVKRSRCGLRPASIDITDYIALRPLNSSFARQQTILAMCSAKTKADPLPGQIDFYLLIYLQIVRHGVATPLQLSPSIAVSTVGWVIKSNEATSHGRTGATSYFVTPCTEMRLA